MVSGKFDEADTLKKIERIFGAIPKPTRILEPEWTEEPIADGPRTFEIRRAGEMKVVAVGYRIPAALHPDAQLINLGADVLGDTPRGRLHKALVETGLATQVFAWPMPAHDPGLAMFGAMLPKDGDVDKAQKILIETVESTFDKEPLQAEDLSLMAREEKTLYERTFADPETFGVDISDFIALGDWRLFFIHRDSWEKMKPEDVMQAWKRYFVRDNRVVGTFIPDNKPQRAQMTPAPTLDQVLSEHQFKEQGQEAEVFDSSPANLNARTDRFTIGDVNVALLPKKTRGETVVVRAQFRYGNYDSRKDKRAVAALMSAMLERGTKTMSREEINDAFTKLQIEGDIGQFTTTREHLADALKLMGELWTQSSMPQKDFDELKAEFANDVQSRMDDPRIQARDAITEHFNHYPKDDPRYRLTSKELKAAIEKTALAIRFAMLIAIPSAVGLTVLSAPVNNLLFRGGNNAEAIRMMMIGASAVIFLSLSTVTNAILQGLNRMNVPVRNALISLALHVIALYIMLMIFNMGIYSMVFASILFALFMCILNAIAIRNTLGYRQEMVKTFLLPAISAAFMGAAAYGVYRGVTLVIHSNVLGTLLAVLVAVAVYGVLLIKLHCIEEDEMYSMPMGRKLTRICRKLHLM